MLQNRLPFERWSWIVTLAAVLLAEPALATTLTTLLFAGPPGDNIYCTATNVGKKPITLTIEILTGSGIADVSTGPQAIMPGQSRFTLEQGDYAYKYCRFSGKFAKKDVRAAGNRVIASGTGLIVSAE